MITSAGCWTRKPETRPSPPVITLISGLAPIRLSHLSRAWQLLAPIRNAARPALPPEPPANTPTFADVAKAVQEVKAGKVEFRVDKTGVIHAPVGKVSFATDKLLENANTLIQAVVRAKPAAAKGKYVKSVTVCSTMGPGVHLDPTRYNLKQV